jgi:RNA polymerase sigma-70 factor (ECF subfamily)
MDAPLLHARCLIAWPGVRVEEAAFSAYLAARGDAPSEHVTDLYIACACALGDARAVGAVDERYLAGLPAHLARRGFALDLAEDVVQSMRERLFVGADGEPPKIVEYSGRGSLLSWFRVTAARAASNARRDANNRARITEGASDDDVPPLDQEMTVIVNRYGPVLREALRDAFEALSSEERSVLRLHFEQGLSLDAVARVLGLSRATVGRRMLSGRQRVLSAMLAMLGERLAASPDEIMSILGVVRSKLDVSLAPLLRSR